MNYSNRLFDKGKYNSTTFIRKISESYKCYHISNKMFVKVECVYIMNLKL